MKTKFFNSFAFVILSLVTICFTSCENELSPSNDGKDYHIVIDGVDSSTKGATLSATLGLADLDKDYNRKFTATLYSGSTPVNGASFTWSFQSDKISALSQLSTDVSSYSVQSAKAGKCNLDVSASLNNQKVATAYVDITVNDNRSVWWSDVQSPVNRGEQKSAVLHSNFTGTVNISSNNTSFSVSTSKTDSYSSSMPVSFNAQNTEKTIWFQYNGSSESIVSMNAVSASNSNISQKTDILSKPLKIYPIVSRGYNQISPDMNYNPGWPGDTERTNNLSNNTFAYWEEIHNYDLNFGSILCHEVTLFSPGYIDDNGTFHEFTDYAVYKDSNLKQTVSFNVSSCLSGTNTLDETDGAFSWSSGSTHNNIKRYTANVYIVVKDAGYEGTYIGTCIKEIEEK